MDVSVILLNYNSTNYTIGAIESIIEKTNKLLNYEIIVVDNNSNSNE